jgi:hypothetical protein
MMQKIVLSFLFLWLVQIVSAQWVTDQNYGFKINVPSNWTQESKMDGSDMVYDFVDPSQNIFLEVRAFKIDGSLNADRIAQAFEQQYLSTGNRVAYEDYTLNNTAGKFAGYTMHVNGLDVGIGTFYAVKNGIGYVLWSMIETRFYQQYSAQTDAILNTFTTIPPKAASQAVVINPINPVSFKLTNMKLGSSLTADYNILPQNESKSFESSITEIFVIWDWEANAAGKTMHIKWFHNGREMTTASKSYTLPDNNQGYGWASLTKPAAGFEPGKYFVQIDFEGTPQRRIDFEVQKPASSQSSGFVIAPPGGNGKALNPPANTSSDFNLDWNGFALGESLKTGSKTELINPTNKFNPNSPQVIAVYKWKGNGSGHKVGVSWKYYPPGSKESMLIAESDFQVPVGNGGASNFSLSRPDAGWPVGQYWVEFSKDGQFFHEMRFDVVEGSSSSSNTGWGKASGAATQSTSSSSSNVKTIVLTSGGSKSCYSFKNGKIHGDHNNADIMVEPWCTADAGVCGNWVLTNQTNMSAVSSPPTSGYISDGKGYTDCQILPANNVAVVKLSDGSYAKMMIQKTNFSNSQSQNPPCQHITTILVEYPAF